MLCPLITIIVCANRDNPFFEAALQSLEVARYRVDGIETLLVANGGWQPSDEIADRFDEVIAINRNGLGHSRNVGVEHARGEWVTFFDADDLLHPDYLIETTRALLEIDGSRAIFFNNVRFIDERDTVLSGTFRLERLPNWLSIRLAHPFTGATLVIRRAMFVETGGYDWVGYAEDYDLTLRLALSWPSLCFRRNRKAEYLYRQHSDTMSGDTRKKILGVREVQLRHARAGAYSMYLGVAASTLRLALNRIRL